MSVVQLCDGGQSPSRVKASMLFRLHYVDFVCAEHQQPAPTIEPICSSVRSTSAKARDKRTCSCETQQQRSSAMAQSPPRKTICQCFQACAISICDNLQGGCLREWQNLSRCLTVSLSFYIKRQDRFTSAAPLSDMAVPKALPTTASELEENRRRFYEALLQRPANKITRRHSPRGTIWLPHILYLLSLPPTVAGFSIYALFPGPPTCCILWNRKISSGQSITGVTDVNTFPCYVWVTSSSQSAVLNNRKNQTLALRQTLCR